MTEHTPIKEALIASICEHRSAEDFQRKLFSEKNIGKLVEQFKEVGEVLSKADFFSRDSDGHHFLDDRNAWNNFERIVDIVHKNGERFAAEDFLREVDTGRGWTTTFLDMAIKYDAVDALMKPEIWKGRYEDIEKICFSIPVGKRIESDLGEKLENLKRSMYALENKTTREDDLKKRGIDWQDIPDAFSKTGGLQRLQSISNALRRQGDRLTKSDLLIASYDGDTLFRRKGAWEEFDAILDILEQNGERLDASDLTFKRGVRESILERAVQHGSLGKIFTPKLWQGRLSEMTSLWHSLKPFEQSTTLGHDEFLSLLSQAEDDTYKGVVNMNENYGIVDLRSPVAVIDDVEVMPLGLASTWKNFDQLQATLERGSENIDMADLRKTSGFLNTSIFEMVIKNGHLNKAVELLASAKESVKLHDFLTKDRNGIDLLTVIAERGELGEVFQPQLWAGRLSDMKKLWAMVSFEDKNQVDWNKTVNETVRLTVDNKGKNKKPSLKRRKRK